MKLTKADARASKTEAALRNADALSLRMYHLGKTLELAAFAAEARRVLVEVDNVLFCRPEMKEIFDGLVPGFNEWKELDDASGEVLRQMARTVEEINSQFTENCYDMASDFESSPKTRVDTLT